MTRSNVTGATLVDLVAVVCAVLHVVVDGFVHLLQGRQRRGKRPRDGQQLLAITQRAQHEQHDRPDRYVVGTDGLQEPPP